jgi:hypothetical protein
VSTPKGQRLAPSQAGQLYLSKKAQLGMANDVVDYSGTSDSDSESDKVPSTGRLSAPAGSCILHMGSASFTGIMMQDADAHHWHRRKRIRSPSVTPRRFDPATLPRASGCSSASSSSALNLDSTRRGARELTASGRPKSGTVGALELDENMK